MQETIIAIVAFYVILQRDLQLRQAIAAFVMPAHWPILVFHPSARHRIKRPLIISPGFYRHAVPFSVMILM